MPRKRDEQSPADSLFADSIREATGREIALLPGVGYGVAKVSDLDFRFDPQALKVVQCAVGGIEIELLKQDAVATNSMLAEGGHNYRTFHHGQNLREHEAQFAIIKQWMVRQKTVKTPSSSRIFKGPEREGDHEHKAN